MDIKSLSEFKRKIRVLTHEARSYGHWVIGDSNGYYLALNRSERNAYKKQRLIAINNELKAIAYCDNIALPDLIKIVYAVILTDRNYDKKYFFYKLK